MIKIIEPGIRDDLKSYWAMHFCSFFETLYEHKTLEFSFRGIIPANQPNTLLNLKGFAEHSFLSKIRGQLHNWGLQYFLCHYLMSPEGSKVFHILMDEISNNYNFNMKKNLYNYGVFVCGIDSYSGQSFLNNNPNVGIFGYDEKTITNVYEDIKYVDLCFLIERFEGDMLNTAILGEVEGNHGQKLKRKSFWNQKASLCVFGIGVEKSDNNDIFIENIKYENNIKTILTLNSNYSIIEDFKITIGIMEAFFFLSHNHKLQYVTGQKDIIEIIKYYWDKPIEDLINTLRDMITRVETANLGTNEISISTIPKIII